MSRCERRVLSRILLFLGKQRQAVTLHCKADSSLHGDHVFQDPIGSGQEGLGSFEVQVPQCKVCAFAGPSTGLMDNVQKLYI